MSKFKALIDNNLTPDKMAKMIFDRVENIVGKGENACYQAASSAFSTTFSTGIFLRVTKSQDCMVKRPVCIPPPPKKKNPEFYLGQNSNH